MADITNLSVFLTDVAEAIRSKEGSGELIPPAEFDIRISELPGQTVLNYTVPQVSKPDSTNYSFNKGSDGYYAATNLGIDSTFSYALIYFELEQEQDITFTYISYGENNYDFLMFSNLDTKLAENYTDASTNVYKSCRGEASTSAKTLVYENVPAGTHFITIKAKKDGSSTTSGEMYKFKSNIITGGNFTIRYPVYAFKSMEDFNNFLNPRENVIAVIYDNENNYMFLYEGGKWKDLLNRPMTQTEYDECTQLATLIQTEKEEDEE